MRRRENKQTRPLFLLYSRPYCPGLLKMSSQLASNRRFHSRIDAMNFSVASSCRSLPKMESTNSVPAFLPSWAVSFPCFLPAFNMGVSHDFRSFFNLSVSRSPDSMKSSTISLFSTVRIRGMHSSARLTLPASWIRSSQSSPAMSAMGVAGP